MEPPREIVIVVDDDITCLAVAKNNLAEKYDVFTAPSGQKLFLLLEKVTPALILLDIEMPDVNGFEVIRTLKNAVKTASIPVIFLTGKIDPESEVKGLNLGAVDYITKPFSRELILKRVDVHILLENQKKELRDYSLSLECEVNKKTKEIFELQSAVMKTVAELVERRDSVMGGHIDRTQNYLGILVNRLLEHGIYVDELSSWDIDMFIMSSQLHDVGKIAIRDDILMKQDQLTNEEFEEMKKHTLLGREIIRKIESTIAECDFLMYAEILAVSHHEKWDGSGYPFGLKGAEIPLQGRLMAIVDVYDALSNERPYKKAFAHEEAINMIKSMVGTHFDPLIGYVFITHEKELKNIEKNPAPAPVMVRDVIRQVNLNQYAINKGASNGGRVANRRPDKAYDSLNSAESLRSTMNTVSNNILAMHEGKGGGHSERMRRYLEILLNSLFTHENYKKELSTWDVDLFLASVQLYDIGKLAIENQLLNKKGKLTEEEFENAKKHADFGISIIQHIKENVENNSLLHHAEALAGSHHEKWDGTGYPLGLRGQGIPLQGRLMALADVYEALTTDRPQRDRMPHREAVDIIRSYSGTHFDPELVEIFMEREKEFERGEGA
jgi:putative two-component system response regulator